ncbi:hypothetical protein AYO40_05310 [Planctomycetaceae bacterium SCGC AG-212-D15]|nr:hypothetical protein AYO40_05310 [Planctomycetaceae bacterium SCGC AG-212-D15]
MGNVANQPFNGVIQRLRRSLARPADGPADAELLSRYAQAREEQAFTTLVERYGGMVWGVCRRVAGQDTDADDAFQATFLTLAAKAGSPFLRESLAGWLYRVAYRTTCRARVQATRRRRTEQAAADRLDRADTAADVRELQRALDEELSRLPERFRLPVLLCCLQDQTTDEAAQQLGWSFATVKGRLQRGRKMLQQRLKKRGIALSASVLATVRAEGTVGAAPINLVTSTVQAALHGTMTPTVAALVKGASRAMLWTKIKLAVAVVVACAVVAVGGLSLSRLGTGVSTALAVPIPEEAEAKEQVKSSKPAVKDGLEIVVTPTAVSFPSGQVPTLTFTYTNRSKVEFALNSINFAVVESYRCVDTKTGAVWQAGPWQYRGTPAPETALVEPGKSVVRTESVRPRYQLLNQKQPIEPRLDLPPGKYLVTAHVVFEGARKINATPRAPFWTGAITTSPVEVIIVDPKAEAERVTQKGATELAQMAAEQALDKAWAPFVGKKFPNGTGIYPAHRGPWLNDCQPTSTETDDGWTFRFHSNVDAGFEFYVEAAVSKTGTVTVRTAVPRFRADHDRRVIARYYWGRGYAGRAEALGQRDALEIVLIG